MRRDIAGPYYASSVCDVDDLGWLGVAEGEVTEMLASIPVVDDDLEPFAADVVAVALARRDAGSWSTMIELRSTVAETWIRAGATVRAKVALDTLLMTEDPSLDGWAQYEDIWHLAVTHDAE